MKPLSLLAAASLSLGSLASVAAAQSCPQEDYASPNHDISAAYQVVNGSPSVLAQLAATQSEPRDFYYLDLAPGESVDLSITFQHSMADLDMVLYDSSMTEIDSSEGTSDTEVLTTVNSTGLTSRIYVQVLNYSALFLAGDCGDYTFIADSSGGSGGPCDGDDVWEDNDDCNTSLALNNLPMNTAVPLVVKPDDYDYFVVQLAPDDTLNVDISFDTSGLTLGLFLRAQFCASTLESEIGNSGGFESFSFRNTAGIFQTYLVVVEAVPGSATCANYDLTWEVVPQAEPCALDDAFEQNDFMCGAVPITTGFYPSLVVGDGDPDFYSIDLDSSRPNVVALEFNNAQGDLDLFVYDATAVDCDDRPLYLSSTSVSNYEEVEIPANGPSSIVIEVRHFTTDGTCNTYAMTIAPGYSGALGQQVCEGESNSTGHPSTVTALGSLVASENNLLVQCVQLPQNSTGFFIASTSYGFVANPGGSQGNLCISGAPVGRFVRPGEIRNTGQSNSVDLMIDLNSIPQPTQTVSIFQDETWHFQYWHRDSIAGTAVSNFSSALRLRFR